MKAFTGTAALTLALLLAGCGGDSGGNSQAGGTSGGTTTAAVPAPNGGDWSKTVAETDKGSFLMGNPDAKVKLVEYGSFTCPHCAEFAEKGVPDLVQKYVKTGQVSFEFRNFVRDPADLAAALLARCGGATPYFQLNEQIFGAQKDWFEKMQSITPAEQQQLQSATPAQVATTIADKAGLIQFVRMRGVPEEKARTCLADQATTERLVAMTNEGSQKYQIPGTPAFLINDSLVPNASDWKALEPALKQAVGG
jgi:protein-disulfide isomerase